MKIILVFFCVLTVTVYGSVLSNVRLQQISEYMVELIGKTVRRVEENEWCNLRVNDVTMDLDEDVLGRDVMGTLEYTNGFVTSIQWVDLLQNSFQQNWRFDRTTNITTVEVTGALLLHSVGIGFDVVATLAQGVERYTGVITHPVLRFNFAVIKNMMTEDLSVNVVGVVARTTNVMDFLPKTNHTHVFASLFDWNSTTIGIQSWATDIFKPIALELVTSEVDFPTICYNCPA